MHIILEGQCITAIPTIRSQFGTQVTMNHFVITITNMRGIDRDLTFDLHIGKSGSIVQD